MANNQTQTQTNAKCVYVMTFGNKITAPTTNLSRLELEQEERKVFVDDNNNSYYLTLRGIKINKKIYQPCEIEGELDITNVTIDSKDDSSSNPPSFSAISALLLQRFVKLELVMVGDNQTIDQARSDNESFVIAENCYVYELNPQLKRDSDSVKMFVKMTIYSMDKLMTLNKYSKAYVARKLGSGILKPESLNFGTISDNVPLITTDPYHLSFLRYLESSTEKDSNGNEQTTTIQTEFIQPYLVQYNESFYDFLVRTANRCGEFLFFEDGKLILGLPDADESDDEITEINTYDSVTLQEMSSDPLEITAYTRDSVKDDDGEVSDLNHSVIEKNSDGFPEDAFPDNTSSNAELAHDDFIFPLVKDKFSDLAREIYYDGSGTEIALYRLIPFFKSILTNTTTGIGGIIASVATAVIVGEGVQAILGFMGQMTANSNGNTNYLDDYKDSDEQYGDDKVVQFASLKSDAWTTIDYYNDILAHEVEQQRQTICIDMGTNIVNVKLGQRIKVKGLDGTYVVIQIKQVSDVKWSRDYEKYGQDASDVYADKRMLKIYAIPSFTDNNEEKFIPPVQPVPIIRKSGPQTAFVTDNTDPKYQGRVRVAYPWQSLGSTVKKDLSNAEEALKQSNAEKEQLEKQKKALSELLTTLSTELEALKKYVTSPKEEREKTLETKTNETLNIQNSIDTSQTECNKQASQLDNLETKKDTSPEEKEKTEIRKQLLINDIQSQESKNEKNQEKKDRIVHQMEEMIAAAEEHDEKYNKDKSYQDLEVDNLVIAAKKRAYDRVQAEYQDCVVKLEEMEEDLSAKTSELETVQAVYDSSVKAMSTPWVRIVSPMATNGGGTFFRPRVGDEVLVNFDNDNIERPYVMGSLYSKNVLTPDERIYRKSAPLMQRKDVSMSIASPNGHHITFTDPEGGASFLANCLSPGLGTYLSLIGYDTSNSSSKDLAGGIHIGDRYGIYEIEMLSHKREINIKSPLGTINMNAFKGITINAPNADVMIKGMNITLEAGNKLNLISGANIPPPAIEDPEGKGNKVGATVVGIIGAVLDSVLQQYAYDVVDFSLIRRVVETFVRPVDGTMLIKSKRYLKLEAGPGNATVKRDRYKKPKKKKSGRLAAVTSAVMTFLQGEEKDKECMEEFYKAVLKCVDYISVKTDEFYDTYAKLWEDGFNKKYEYKRIAKDLLKQKNEPNIASLAFNTAPWKEDTISLDTFQDYFDDKLEYYKNQWIGKKPAIKYAYLEEEAQAYGKAAYTLIQYSKNASMILNNIEDTLDLGDYNWVRDCAKTCINQVTDNWDAKWVNFYREGDEDEFLYNPEPTASSDPFAMSNKAIYKRKFLLAFLYKVNDHANNENSKYIKLYLDMDYVNKTNSYRQEHYWKRQVLNMDVKYNKSNLWKTIYDKAFTTTIAKFKANFSSLDQDVWDGSKSGQILFSDQEGSTLNFKGAGLVEETDANIGTMDHLKRVLMAMK